MPFVELPDFVMHYVVHGAGPETVVCIHGNLASARWWNQLFPRMPARYRVVAMDLRGCGQSGRPKEGYTIHQFACDIKLLTEHLTLNSFHVLGHSMGGQIAAYLALEHPEGIKTLAMLNAVPATGLALDHEARAGFALLRQNKDQLKKAIDSCMPYAADNGESARLALEDAWNCAPEVYRENPETMHETVLMNRIGTIAAPVLIMHGQDDSIIPLPTVWSTIRAMPKAETVIFEHCGHSPQVEIPDVFVHTYLNFLAKN